MATLRAPSATAKQVAPLPAELSSAALSSTFSAAVVLIDEHERVLHAEGEALVRHGLPPEECRGLCLKEILPAGAYRELRPRYQAAMSGQPQSFDYWTQNRRSAYWVQISPVQEEGRRMRQVLAVMQDVTARLRTTAELARSEARLREAERMVGLGSWELSLSDGSITYSPGAARLMGLKSGRALDLESFWALVHPEDQKAMQEAIERAIREGRAELEYRLIRADDHEQRILRVAGEAVPGEDGEPELLRGAVLDITEEREADQERMLAMSLYREGFDAAPIGMVVYGTSGQIIRANRAMCRIVGREDLTGMSIDELTLAEDQAATVSSRKALISGEISQFDWEKRYVRPDGSVVWASVHTAPVRHGDGSVRAVFSQVVDISERKERDAELETHISEAMWLARIRDALDQDRFVLYEQPIIDLATGQQVQRELLLRMREADGSVIAPGQFLPTAERYGIMREIDRWVIRHAVALAADGTPTELNLSSASLADPEILRELGEAIATHGVDPSLLVVEVTETAMLEQPGSGQSFARAVEELGCQLALDDFGTGYAGLSYLKQLPAQHLKIDLEFVRELRHDESTRRLVRGIVALAREFRQLTVAEGVEDKETLELLRELGVDRVQGYLLGRPTPVKLRLRRSRRTASPRSAPEDVERVREFFDACGRQDLAGIRKLFLPRSVLRPYLTPAGGGGGGGERIYLGHRGLQRYFEDVAELWDEVRNEPWSFWPIDGGVAVFGLVLARRGASVHREHVLSLFRLRDGRICSAEVYPDPSRPRGASGLPAQNGQQ